MEPIVEVTQADREAAAGLLGKLSNSAQEDWALSMMRLGKHDDADIVQAMAKHRLSSPSPDLKAENAALVERYRHKKRGTVYEVIGVAELQAATIDVHEGDGLVIYRGDDGKLWARMADEFHDGRFEALQATEPRP